MSLAKVKSKAQSVIQAMKDDLKLLDKNQQIEYINDIMDVGDDLLSKAWEDVDDVVFEDDEDIA